MDMILPIREGPPTAIADEAVAAGLDRLPIPRKALTHRRSPGRLILERTPFAFDRRPWG